MPSTPHRDDERFESLKQALTGVGLFRRGSVARRFMPCGTPGCRCQASPPQLHGPYYQWTRKVKGKTVTVRLTADQARLFQQWIAHGRHLDRIVAQLHAVSARITQRILDRLQKR